jgi:ABC-2 type transport system ATP-binding protein
MRTTVTVRTRGDSQTLDQLPYVHDFTREDGQVRFSVDREDLDFTMEHLTDLGIEELIVTPASLEDLFLREYQGVN